MWCANCEQMVAPQKPKGNRGLIFVALVVTGFLLLLIVSPLGVATLAFSALYFVIGLFMDVGNAVAAGGAPQHECGKKKAGVTHRRSPERGCTTRGQTFNTGVQSGIDHAANATETCHSNQGRGAGIDNVANLTAETC